MQSDDINNKTGNPGKLRFGILCNGYNFKKWQVKIIDNLLESGKAELCLLIVNSSPIEKKSFLHKILSKFREHLFYRIYIHYFSKPDSTKEIDLSEKLKDIPALECSVIRKGKYSEYFADNDLKEIKTHSLDFMMRFGFNILRGEILESARFGIWSFHHDDEEKYRGGPPGFWEIYSNDNVNGAILQRLTERIDSGIILKKGYFKTIDHSYKANIDNLFYGVTLWPLQVCIDILNGVADYTGFLPSSTAAKVHRNPSNLQMIKFILKIFFNKICFHYRELFCTEHWNIGVIKESLVNLIDYGFPENKIKWMPAQKPVNFRADSFAYMNSDKLNICFEDYDYRTRKGKISKADYNEETGFTSIKTILEKEYHLAYPFIFNYDNQTYLIPESFENNQVDLYIINQESGELQFHSTILQNIDAVDSTVFFHNGKWWLFCTRNSDDSNSNLYLFYSDNLDGQYFTHPANPVKTDIRSARPAGKPFMKGAELYRPSQDSSATYGGKIALNRILKLNTLEFREETTGYIGPFKNSDYNYGIHTICEAGDHTVFDAKKLTFVGKAFWYQLRRKAKKFIGNRQH